MKTDLELQEDWFEQLTQKLTDGSLVVDLNGHKIDEINISRVISMSRTARLITSIKEKTKVSFKKPIKLTKSIFCQCQNCEEEIQLQTDGKEITCLEPCKQPDGFPEFVFELNVHVTLAGLLCSVEVNGAE